MYLFVAHKPRSESWFRGDCQAVYEDDFVLRVNLNTETLTSILAEYNWRNSTLSEDEDPYDIYVFEDGHPVMPAKSYGPDLTEIFKEVEKLTAIRLDKVKIAKAELEIKEKEIREFMRVEARRKQYEELKKEFESP